MEAKLITYLYEDIEEGEFTCLSHIDIDNEIEIYQYGFRQISFDTYGNPVFIYTEDFLTSGININEFSTSLIREFLNDESMHSYHEVLDKLLMLNNNGSIHIYHHNLINDYISSNHNYEKDFNPRDFL